MTGDKPDPIQVLVAKASEFLLVSGDFTTPQACVDDPCPYCTAGAELQEAILDVQDLLENNANLPKEGGD